MTKTKSAITSVQDLRDFFDDKSLYWLGRSHFLYRGMESYARQFYFIPTTGHGRYLSQQIGLRTADFDAIADDTNGTKCLLAFDADVELTKRGKSARATVCLPSAATMRRLANKFEFPELLRASGQAVPWHTMVRRPTLRSVTTAMKRAPSATVVAQTHLNNLTGRGTFWLRGEIDVPALLRENFSQVKITEFIEGQPLTVSGCIANGEVYVSCVSRQLVGLPELTACWAAHCGNQPVDTQSLSEATLRRIQTYGRRVGKTLAERGLVGQFGIDLMLTDDGRVLGLELNPRVQSVSSLVQATELVHGRIPLQAMHVLGFLKRRFKQSFLAPFQTTLHSQMIVEHLSASGTVGRTIQPGAYSFHAGRLALEDVTADLTTLRPEHWLITPQVVRGDQLETGTKMFIVQRQGAITSRGGVLAEEARKLVQVLRRKVVAS